MKKIIIETSRGAEIVEVPDNHQETNKEKTLVTIEIPNDCEVKIVKKEEKKNPIVRTYQDLIDNDIIMEEGYWIDEDSKICRTGYYSITGNSDKNIAISEKVAKSMLAMAMISQLMPYYGGAITDEEWGNSNILKHVIERINNDIHTDYYNESFHFLAFHTEEQRDEFLKYNEQLVKDYLMIE